MKSQIRYFAWVSLLLIAALAAWGCPSGPVEKESDMEEVRESGWEPTRVVAGEELDEEEIEALLSRLPPLEADEADQVSFKRREDSMRPPLTGEDVYGEWPPDLSNPTAQVVTDGPLRAQAFRPDGEVEPPFQVAIAFDRAVVDLGAVGTQDVGPFSMTPNVEGRWRWIGTQTVIFEPEDAWPMATEYEIEVSPSLRAVDGSSLAEELRFQFTTPGPRIQTFYPSDGTPQARDAAVAVVFNQAIDPVSANAIEVAQGRSKIPMRLLEGAALGEVAEKFGVEEAVQEGRVLAFRPERLYAPGQRTTLTVDGPLASLEGPVVEQASRTHRFTVRGAMKLQEIRCGWSHDCRPGMPIQLVFSNPADIDGDQFDLQVEPSVDDLHVTHGEGSTVVNVTGDFQPRREYRFTVPDDTRDIFDQTIEGDRSRSIEVGPYRPMVVGPNQRLLVRPKASAPILPFRVAELSSVRVRIFDVSDDHWDDVVGNFGHRGGSIDLSPVHEETVSFSRAERRQIGDLPVDYSAALDGGVGHALVVIDEPTPWQSHYKPSWHYWVQHTDLAVDIHTNSRELMLAVTSLADGQAIEGATAELGPHRPVSTDATGEVSLDLTEIDDATRPLIVSHEGQSLIVPPAGQVRWFSQHYQWDIRDLRTDLLWYVVDDRQMYKPGETVNVRGWIRQLERSPRSDLMGMHESVEVTYTVREPRGNEIDEGRISVDALGGFEFQFDIPDGANLGHATIELSAYGPGLRADLRQTSHRVQIQEFRRPEYEVQLSTSEAPHRVGEETRWEVEATYYAGGAVTGAPVSWRFSESAANFQPAGWSGWSFGKWSPWWSPWMHRGGASSSSPQVLPEGYRGFRAAETDSMGRDTQQMTFVAPERGFPRRVLATASVTDVNRQSWEATDSVLVHPAAVYVGLKSEQNFVHRDEPWTVDAVVVDVDGEAVDEADIEIELQRRRGWEDFESVTSCTQTFSGEALSCSFDELSPGSYRAVAKVEDERGRISETETNFWVAGRDTSGAETAEEDDLILVPETEKFSVGDTAKLFVQAPYYPLDAVVELRRDGTYERRRVELTADDPFVEVEIEESMIPNVHVEVLALGADDAYKADHFASGSIALEVDRGPRALDVSVEPGKKKIAPGDDLEVTTRVVDPEGEPVEGAQVLVFAVDESVLALSDYELTDPLSIFYPSRQPGVRDIRSRAWLLLDDNDADLEVEEALEQQQDGAMGRGVRRRSARGGGGAAPPAPGRMAAPMEAAFGSSADVGSGVPTGGAQQPIALREVFDALAFFRSDLITDTDGVVTFAQGMPDSLTRYRIMAVAVSGDRYFGAGETNVTARRPLMVRPSAPRFLNVGDSFELPVVIHNRSDRDRRVSLALRSTSALEWIDVPGRAIEVPADDRVETRIAARVKSAGETRIQVVVADEEYSDAELVTLPVLTPATTEAFATHGSIGPEDDDALLQALKVPDEAYREYGGLEVMTSSTQMQALTDAFIYLTNYQFMCSEQLASRILSVIALYDVLDAFEARQLPSPQALRASMERWMDDLKALQRSNGGFAFWAGSPGTSPYASVHATLALAMATDEGYEVEDHILRNADNYLRNIDSRLQDYHPRTRMSVESYALHVRHRMGRANQSDLDSLVTRYGVDELPLEALGWLLPMAEGTRWEQRFMQRITNQVQETAATAEFQETYSVDAHRILHTTRRTDGVVLRGLVEVDPQHHLVEKVARGLMAHRTRGRWANTQENVFILMALRSYFDAYEDVEPEFVARAWLGDDQIGDHSFSGRTTERHNTEVPMSFLAEQGDHLPLVLQRDGDGRMYYRLGVRYAPKSRMLPAHDEGFAVERLYEAVDDPEDVTRTDQGWEIRAGARVRVVLTMTIPARRYHVALVDWLPAGFEPVNTALSVSAVEDDLVGGSSDRRMWYWWWTRPWFEHENMRDERVEAFSALVNEGVHTYSYVARATTPGEFIAMPAKAEEMYHPETFGRSNSEIVTIVDR